MPDPMTQNEASVINADSGKLDVVRSLAVLLVVISHLPLTKHISDLIFGMNKINVHLVGVFGVGIFFVHTCLVLMASLERQTLDYGSKKRFQTFIIRRVFRIYPLSITTVLSLTLISYLFSNNKIDLSQVLSNLLLIQNITGDISVPITLWSLPYEVQMYLCLPALYLLITRYKNHAFSLILFLWFASVVFIGALSAIHQNYQLILYLPAFIPGVLAFTLLSRKTSDRLLPSYVPAIYIIFVSLSLPLLAYAGVHKHLLLWLACLALGILLPYSSEIISPAVKTISSKIAKYSYGIYLVHVPMISFSFEYLKAHSSLLQWIIFILGTVSISYLAFHLIENPGIQIGKRVAKLIRPPSSSSRRDTLVQESN